MHFLQLLVVFGAYVLVAESPDGIFVRFRIVEVVRSVAAFGHTTRNHVR